jgi:hypothetical protein
VLEAVATDDGIEALVVLNDDVAAQAGDTHPHALDDNFAMELVTSWPA